MTTNEHEAKMYRSIARANFDLGRLRKMSPQHHWLLQAFDHDRLYISGVAGPEGCGYTIYATGADLAGAQ